MSVGLLVVGSPAVVTDPNHSAYRVVVERIGRKYVYVRGDERGFDRETGLRADKWGNTRLHTVEEYEHSRAVEKAWRELFDFGIRVEHSIPGAVLLEIRAALLGIVPAPPSSNEREKT